MTAEAVKRELDRALSGVWPEELREGRLPHAGYWRKAEAWLGFHAPHVGDALVEKLITELLAECLSAHERGEEPVAREVPEAVRKIWEAADRRTEGPAPGKAREEIATGRRAPFLAPMRGPTPGALRRTRKLMKQGLLGAW